jgi:hypothetical protein
MSESESLLPVKGSVMDDEGALNLEYRGEAVPPYKSPMYGRQSLFIVLNVISVVLFVLNLTAFMTGWQTFGKLKESYCK